MTPPCRKVASVCQAAVVTGRTAPLKVLGRESVGVGAASRSALGCGCRSARGTYHDRNSLYPRAASASMTESPTDPERRMQPDPTLSVSDLLQRARLQALGELDVLFAACRNYLALLARNQIESWLQAK